MGKGDPAALKNAAAFDDAREAIAAEWLSGFLLPRVSTESRAVVALERFGWKATTPLAEGLKKTLDWYLAARRRP